MKGKKPLHRKDDEDGKKKKKAQLEQEKVDQAS